MIEIARDSRKDDRRQQGRGTMALFAKEERVGGESGSAGIDENR